MVYSAEMSEKLVRKEETVGHHVWPVQYSLELVDGFNVEGLDRLDVTDGSVGKRILTVAFDKAYSLLVPHLYVTENGDVPLEIMPLIGELDVQNCRINDEEGHWHPYRDVGVVFTSFSNCTLRIPLFLTSADRVWPSPPHPIRQPNSFTLDPVTTIPRTLFPLATYSLASRVLRENKVGTTVTKVDTLSA